MDRLGCVEVGRFVGVRLWKSRFWGMRGTCSYTQRTPLRALGPPSKASHKQCRWDLAVDDWNSRCKLCTREPDSGFCLIKQLDYISGLVASLFGTVMYCMIYGIETTQTLTRFLSRYFVWFVVAYDNFLII